jgi:hypothetical protein
LALGVWHGLARLARFVCPISDERRRVLGPAAAHVR